MTTYHANRLFRGLWGRLVFVLLLSICATTLITFNRAVVAEQVRNTAYTELAIRGLKNDADAESAQKALSAVAGVVEVKVSREDGRAYIVLDGDAIPEQESLIRAVKAAGFDAGSTVGRDYQEHETFDSREAETCTDPGHDHSDETASSTKTRPAKLFTLSKDARELKTRFNEDADKLRLVVLLSPT